MQGRPGASPNPLLHGKLTCLKILDTRLIRLWGSLYLSQLSNLKYQQMKRYLFELLVDTKDLLTKKEKLAWTTDLLKSYRFQMNALKYHAKILDKMLANRLQ